MSAQPTRSEEVIDNYKKHKVARSALRHIQNLLHGFERERRFDVKMARVGLVLLLLLVAGSLYWLSSIDSTILR